MLKLISLKVRDRQDQKEIAKLSALQINRGLMAENAQFLRILDEDEEELAQFSSTLFNKFGEIRPSIVEDEKFKGTGCWGRELNEGMLCYIYYVYVAEESVRTCRYMRPFYFH